AVQVHVCPLPSSSCSQVCSSAQVSAVEMFQGDQFLLLPCGFPTFDLENPTVVWTRQDLSPPTVHQRLPEGDQLKDQNQLYRGRTSMKADALVSGDLSLNLTNLQLSDSGTYTCSVTDFGEELSRTDVELKVKGQRSLCPSCVSSERFPSWAIAILVLLVLIVSAGPDIPLPSHLDQLLRGNPKAFPGQVRDIVPPPCPGSTFRPSPGWTFPENLTREASRRHPNQIPSCFDWLLSMWRSSKSTPIPSWITQLLTLPLRESPDTLRRKLISAVISFFRSLPKARDHR
uniref:Ig-like domain-containing protein n=1 Tax=Nothobranchius furzeri TaxID=105023 RepID=A0A8C6NX42_NOTFU